MNNFFFTFSDVLVHEGNTDFTTYSLAGYDAGLSAKGKVKIGEWKECPIGSFVVGFKAVLGATHGRESFQGWTWDDGEMDMDEDGVINIILKCAFQNKTEA